MFKKAIILGGSGFIGTNMAHELIQHGFEVIIFDRTISPALPKQCRIITGDLYNYPQELLREINDCFIFHLASSGRPNPDTTQALEEIKDISSTVKLLEDTKGRAVRWVFLSSGGTVYGPGQGMPIKEVSVTAPICSYGVTKLAIERYFALYHNLHGTDYISLRLSNPYGPWQSPLRGQGLIPTVIYKGLAGLPIDIWGDGRAIRDFIYIADATAGILASAQKGLSGETYNLGSGVGASTINILSLVNEALGIELLINNLPARGVDVPINILCCEKIRATTNWSPNTDLISGIKYLANWIAEYYHRDFLRTANN